MAEGVARPTVCQQTWISIAWFDRACPESAEGLATNGTYDLRAEGVEVDIPAKVGEFIAGHRVARLATADGKAAPHVVPITYAFDGRHVFSVIDLKPKRVAARRLKRVRNVLKNPQVAVVIDDYSEEWDELAYVLIRGLAEVLEDGEERQRGEELLRQKYPQYERLLEPGCLVLKITPERVVSWGREFER